MPYLLCKQASGAQAVSAATGIVDAEGARLGVSCPRCATARRQAAEVAVPVEW